MLRSGVLFISFKGNVVNIPIAKLGAILCAAREVAAQPQPDK